MEFHWVCFGRREEYFVRGLIVSLSFYALLQLNSFLSIFVIFLISGIGC